jgi:hypothetical protein
VFALVRSRAAHSVSQSVSYAYFVCNSALVMPDSSDETV